MQEITKPHCGICGNPTKFLGLDKHPRTGEILNVFQCVVCHVETDIRTGQFENKELTYLENK